jgi:hypothetical protein
VDLSTLKRQIPPSPRPPTFPQAQRTAAQQSTTVTIPSQNPPRRPANIPLRTLSSAASRSDPLSERLLASQSDEKQGRRSSLSRSSSPSSEFSWSDTGDLAEQLADAEDPLRIQLPAYLGDQVFGGSSRRPTRRKIRYNASEAVERKEYHPGLAKEEIEIPNPAPRYITRGEHILAAIMSGGERQMHGLTGKPLV